LKEMNGFGAQVPEGTYYFMCSLEKYKNKVYNSANNGVSNKKAKIGF